MEYEYIKHLEGTSLKTFVVTINHRLFHFHSDMELLLVIEGTIKIISGQKQFFLRKDDIFLTNKNEIHSLLAQNEPNVLLVIQFDPNLCKSYFPQMSRMHFNDRLIQKDSHIEYWQNLKECLIDIIHCYSQKYTGYPLQMMSILNQMLYCLIRYADYTEIEERQLVKEKRNMDRLHRILDTIQQNYMNKITLKKIAEDENLDMYYLSHFIKEHLGITFLQYLNKLRLEKAEELLLNTDMRNIDICMECGFSDYKYLQNAFLKEYHCSPSEYKKIHKEKTSHSFWYSERTQQHVIMDDNEAFLRLSKYIVKQS